MVSSREDFLMNLLNCGSLDLKLIDDVGYDWCEILDADAIAGIADCKGKRECGINYLMLLVVEFGIGQIDAAVNERVSELEAAQDERELDEKEKNELVALKVLSPYADIESYHNCVDTHVWFEQNADLYCTYLNDALNDFEEGTGLVIRSD